MVKLPDYSKCVNITSLLHQMGVKEILLFEIPPIEFVKIKMESKLTTVPNPMLEFAENMQKTSIPLENGTFTIADDGTLELNGLKCSIYIKNQRSGIDLAKKTSTYKYHLANCKTIQQMRDAGRYSRYVATSRDDELFVVNNQMVFKPQEDILKLTLCQNCRDHLIHSGMYSEPFTLKKFYEKYQTKFEQTVQREEQVPLTTQYAPDHAEIAQRYKTEAQYTCQQCGVNCSNHKSLIHLHHRDGDGNNNSHDNLRVLCVDCHSKQPMHSQLLRISNFERDCVKVTQLRKSQGIHMV